MGDHGLNPGEDFELMGSDLFDPAADVTISYAAESDSESTASVSVVDGTIAVMPTSEACTAHVTVTATATPTASSVEIIEQTEANVARILFPVEVTLEPPARSACRSRRHGHRRGHVGQADGVGQPAGLHGHRRDDRA